MRFYICLKIWVAFFSEDNKNVYVKFMHSQGNRKVSLGGSLDRVLFATELEFDWT